MKVTTSSVDSNDCTFFSPAPIVWWKRGTEYCWLRRSK